MLFHCCCALIVELFNKYLIQIGNVILYVCAVCEFLNESYAFLLFNIFGFVCLCYLKANMNDFRSRPNTHKSNSSATESTLAACLCAHNITMNVFVCVCFLFFYYIAILAICIPLVLFLLNRSPSEWNRASFIHLHLII